MTPGSLKELTLFEGHPAQFWMALLDFVSQQLEAEESFLFTRQKDNWQLLNHQSTATDSHKDRTLSEKFLLCIDKSFNSGNSHSVHPDDATRQLLFFNFSQGETAPRLAVFSIAQSTEADIKVKLLQLRLLAETPEIYQHFRSLQNNQKKLDFFARLLKLLNEQNTCDSFLQAALSLVNSVVADWSCSRVSLGWLEKGYINLQAISHMENFDAKMELVGHLEAAMEEAADQDQDIHYPNAADGPVNHDHESYARQQKCDYLLSLPIRLNDVVVGVLTCELQEKSLSQDELLSLRLLLEQLAFRLTELKQKERPAIRKIQDWLKVKSETLLGPQHTLIKLSVISVFSLLICSLLIKIPYRVEAPAILRSADVRQVTAPVDGFIKEVLIKRGDQVQSDQLLLTLDNRDLYLEESAALANQLRYIRETEKARARGSLVDMKIAQAQTDQATAQLTLIRHRLDQLQVRTLIDGIIVEGEFDELLGAPVSKGDMLCKVARHEQQFIELKIAERDIHEIAPGQQAELALIGRPGDKFLFSLEQVDPVADPDESGNVFVASGKTGPPQASWWRPGMSGTVKIEVGDRSMFWVFSHRTIDFLRMLMWW